MVLMAVGCGEVVRTIGDSGTGDPVFVSSSRGDDANPGSKASPVKSLAHAIAIANGRAIDACGETFTESIVVPSGSALHGGFDCTQDWTYVATSPTQLIGAADSIPLTLAGGAATTTVTDFAVEAFDSKLVGGSSVAVLANTGAVELDRCRVTAGAGANGVAGAAQQAVAASADGARGVDDGQCFMVNPTGGGTGGAQTCGAIDVSGGSGGTGSTSPVGGNGIAGLPSGGAGGVGQGITPCNTGFPGASGSAGPASTGARGLGTLTASGFTAPVAADASAGYPGQGGGGGGGAKQCGQVVKAGSSGGGGGGGGCGGAPGIAGSSGGSSLGIVAVDATLTLHDVTITTGKAGDGGLGGDGQPGGLGGQPGAGGNTGACAGGAGGTGGRGGSGGGGAGGHSIGVAFVGSAPDLGTVNIAIGTAGKGALGGDASTAASGDDGVACKSLDFADATSYAH